ncbi:hypothetical protein CCACVL1_29703 [Corchorus capsularis]|uniref:Uncharacterized protein n=1 Tax=Corchorus capsularis TaxID=210143 RepID=A0A1R3G0G6_COCAP|nr:hypothetical protein CCACVL1_29703 [Corchorus capsularis]
MAAETEDEMNSPHTQMPAQDSIEGSCQNKKRKKDPLVEIVSEMATSLKEYVEMKKSQSLLREAATRRRRRRKEGIS